MGHPQFWLTGVLSSGENLARGRRRSEIDCVCWVCDFSRLYLLVVGCGTEVREMRRLCVSKGTKIVFRRRASFGLRAFRGVVIGPVGAEWRVGRVRSRAALIGVHALPGVGGARAVVWEPTLRRQAARCPATVCPCPARQSGVRPGCTRVRARAGSSGSGRRAGPVAPIVAVNDSCLYMTFLMCRSGQCARSATTCRSRFRAFPAPDHCQCPS